MDQDYYRPQPMAANSGYEAKSSHVAGFLATVVGTVTITDDEGNAVVTALPLALGFNRIPLRLNTRGCTVQLAGGAAGTLLL
jgi:hypothetical protein